MFLVVVRESRTFQLLMLAWASKCTESWEGTQPGQLTQTGQMGYSITHDIMLSI